MKRLLMQVYTKDWAEAFAFYKDAFNAEIGYSEKMKTVT